MTTEQLHEVFKQRGTEPDPDLSGAMSFQVMDRSGDTKYIWDRNNADEVEAARTLFNKLVGEKRFAAFHVTGKDGEKGEQMREFDPRAGRVIFVPPLAGG